MDEKICRFCLQTVTENYHLIEETLNNIIKLNLAISKESVTCSECMNSIQIFIRWKSTCINMKKETLQITDLKNVVSLDPIKIENTHDLKPATGPKDDIKCSFCANTCKEGLISLNESKENMFVVDMLEKHFPELDLNNTEKLSTCQMCLDELQNVSSFLIKCMEVEEKIIKFTEMVGTDDKGQVELQDVQQFIFKPTLKLEFCNKNDLEQIYDQNREEYTMKAETEIKYETEVDDLQLNIKTEHINIKSDEIDCERFKEPPTEIKLDSDPVEVSLCKYEICSCKTNQKGKLAYNCEACSYKTECESNMNPHQSTHTKLIHRNASEISMHKCEMCTYETKRKYDLNRHIMWVHKYLSHNTLYKCESCSYESKHRQSLDRHKLIHKDPSEISMFKCELCPYEARYKRYLNIHVLRAHECISEEKYKCEFCTYETKRKEYFNRHKLIHVSPTELSMFKCKLCTFEAKYSPYLNRHVLRVHKNLPDSRSYKCESCTYETKHKDYFKRHKLIHRSPSEISMFKCNMCTYETKHKHALNRHIMCIHKKLSDKTMYKCESCTFETKHKEYLNRHQLIHRSPSEISMFKCELCTFEAKCKRFLNRHVWHVHK